MRAWINLVLPGLSSRKGGRYAVNGFGVQASDSQVIRVAGPGLKLRESSQRHAVAAVPKCHWVFRHPGIEVNLEASRHQASLSLPVSSATMSACFCLAIFSDGSAQLCSVSMMFCVLSKHTP